MRRLAFIIGIVIWFVPAVRAAAAVDLELPPSDGFLAWNSGERKFSAAIESTPLKKIMAKVGAATGWKVFIDPAAEHNVSAQFTNRASGEALRLLLGGLNFAVVPQDDGPTKLLVFKRSARDATEFIAPAVKPGGSKDRIKNELIVSLSRGSKRDIEALARLLGAKIVGRNDKLRSYRLQFDSEDAAEKARNQLASVPDARVDDNYYLRPPDNLANQGGIPSPFNLKPDVNPDGSRTIVAVVDTAVQALDASMSQFVLPTINVAGAPDPAQLASSVPLHGTSMVETLLNSVGTAAEGAEGTGVRVLPVNVYGSSESTSTYEVTMGVYEAVRNGASIVNLSLGGDGDSPLLDDLISQARDRGVIFFAAAGNAPTTAPTFPAAFPLVYAVTAGDANGNYAAYANRGGFVDFIAPGTSFMDYGGMTYRITGTSPATATVSGAAAMYLSAGHSMQETQARLQQMFGIQARK